MKDTVIMYHAECLDGFGGAYAAWKKFGDSARYEPMRRGQALPQDLAGKDVYCIDFTLPQEETGRIKSEARSLTILDHHLGAKEVVESVENHVFDNDRSGATIAWHYFHRETPVPRLLKHIEDADLWRHALPHAKEVGLFLSIQPFEFPVWEELVAWFEDEKQYEELVKIGGHFSQYYESVVQHFLDEAFPVEFEGHRVMAANVANFFASTVGNRLAQSNPPFGLTWHTERDFDHYSLRGDGEVDLSELARRHGGNGHRGAAGFKLPVGTPFPFRRL